MFRSLIVLLAIGFVLYGLVLFGPGAPETRSQLTAPIATAVEQLAARSDPARSTPTTRRQAAETARIEAVETEQDADGASAPPSKRRRVSLAEPLPPLPDLGPAPVEPSGFVRNRVVDLSGEPPDLTAAEVLRDVARTATPESRHSTPALARPALPDRPAINHENAHRVDEVFAVNRQNARIFGELAELFNDR